MGLGQNWVFWAQTRLRTLSEEPGVAPSRRQSESGRQLFSNLGEVLTLQNVGKFPKLTNLRTIGLKN